MDFNDTPDEAAFRAEARQWLSANAVLRPPGKSRAGLLDAEANEVGLLARAKQWQAKKADAKWACITGPGEFGGRGASGIQNVIFSQGEAEFGLPPSSFGIREGRMGRVGPTIMAHGTPAQKKRYLEPMLRADEVWCQLFSEPAAGSDLAGLRTSAVKDGDSWIINGQKIWTTGAHYSDWGMIVT